GRSPSSASSRAIPTMASVATIRHAAATAGANETAATSPRRSERSSFFADLRPLLFPDVVARHEALEAATVDLGVAGGLRDVALGLVERLADVGALEALDPGLLRLVVGERQECGVDGAAAHAAHAGVGHARVHDGVAGGGLGSEHAPALDDVAQLA